MTIFDIPTELTRHNIDKSISDYLSLLINIPLSFHADNTLDFLTKLKRKRLETGPYPKTTLFESANRIMTDLTILHGIKMLFEGFIKEIDFDKYHVEYGHNNFNGYDIEASKEGKKLIGEGFNVAESFFQLKKYNSLKKLRLQNPNVDFILLIYNSDAVKENFRPKTQKNEYYLKVTLDL